MINKNNNKLINRLYNFKFNSATEYIENEEFNPTVAGIKKYLPGGGDELKDTFTAEEVQEFVDKNL